MIGVRIEPMSAGTLREAINLINMVFPPEEEEESAGDELTASLFPEEYKEFFSGSKIRPGLKYWVAIDKSGAVVGTTGLYEYETDEAEAFWLGWFVVHPAKRNKGVGTALLRFSIDEAKKGGKRFLRLYTGDGPVEEAARRIYERHGFKIIREEPQEDWVKLYYELDLRGTT